MPSVTSVYSWMKDDEDIKKQVMDARQLGAWSYLDEMLEFIGAWLVNRDPIESCAPVEA